MDRGLNRCDFGTFQTDSKDLIPALLLRLPVAGSVLKGGKLPSTFHDEMGRSKVKKRLFEVTPLAAIASLVLSGAAWAGNTDDFGCSNAILKGEYAFGGTNYTLLEVFNGIRVYDGNGHFTQRDYQGNSVPAEFAPPGQETGNYTVNSDCTGSDELDLNVPVSSGSTGVIKVLFVISDGGRHIHEVVSELTPPGSTTGPVPASEPSTDSSAW